MTTAETPAVAANLARIRQQIKTASDDYPGVGSTAPPVTLVAVSKRQPSAD